MNSMVLFFLWWRISFRINSCFPIDFTPSCIWTFSHRRLFSRSRRFWQTFFYRLSVDFNYYALLFEIEFHSFRFYPGLLISDHFSITKCQHFSDVDEPQLFWCLIHVLQFINIIIFETYRFISVPFADFSCNIFCRSFHRVLLSEYVKEI